MSNILLKNRTLFFLALDVIIINLVTFLIFEKLHQSIFFHTYISFFWIVSSSLTGYYKVYRYTNFFKVIRLIIVQNLFYTLGFFAFFGVFKEGEIVHTQTKTLLLTYVFLAGAKTLAFFLLKKFRGLGQDFKKVVFFERDSTSKKMISLFKKQKNYGYDFLGFFSNKPSLQESYLGNEIKLYKFLNENKVDEIYATLSQLKKQQVAELTKFSNLHNITLKLIPSSKELYSKSREVEFYNDTIKVLSVRKLPFNTTESRFLKRFFDITFSLLVMLLVLSWLVPILWILIKLESRGPAIFKQKREGIYGDEFVCYKFRSMRLNRQSSTVHTTKNDRRVTRIGAFLRRTSIDELPQFFNVFLGDMSVVGPRPHLESLAIEYQKDVENYIDRHKVKPGITGLAQISGYRGEIRKRSDIKNRVRLDIFYIENWSFLLDIKIIIQTVLKVFKGDEKAY